LSDVAARHSVTLTSASKGWNVPGLKCAEIVLTNEADVEKWDHLPPLKTHGAGILGILANRVAFEEGEPWLREVVSYLDGNRKLLADLIAQLMPQVVYRVPEATYLAWLDCSALGIDEPAAFFLRQAKVALNDGKAFGRAGQGCVRLNFATSRANLRTIVERLATALHGAQETTTAAS
jgi:cystathionine beta-lyase